MSFISLRENLANKCLMIKNKFKKMNAVEPPLRANSPRRPFFREGGQGGGGSPCLESCLDLSTTATRPLSFVTKEAVVKRFNCKIKKE